MNLIPIMTVLEPSKGEIRPIPKQLPTADSQILYTRANMRRSYDLEVNLNQAQPLNPKLLTQLQVRHPHRNLRPQRKLSLNQMSQIQNQIQLLITPSYSIHS